MEIDLLKQALEYHRAGDFAQAEKMYRQVLQSDPLNHKALQMFVILAHQAGRSDIGLKLLEAAIDIDEGIRIKRIPILGETGLAVRIIHYRLALL